jgi:hypothetical protein
MLKNVSLKYPLKHSELVIWVNWMNGYLFDWMSGYPAGILIE